MIMSNCAEALPATIPELPDQESDRICANSLNFQSVNPDAPMVGRFRPCTCGRQLEIGKDWYTEIYDGTLLCWMCSACHRCGLACETGCRQLVSISGYVLCYNCVRHFGEMRACTWQPKVVRHRTLGFPLPWEKAHTAAIAAGPVAVSADINHPASGGGGGVPALVAGHNHEYTSNWRQMARSPKWRWVLNPQDYPRLVRPIPSNLDPYAKPVGFFSASRVRFDRMACPTCQSPATKRAYVVPAVSMVYHRECFRCMACRAPLDRQCLMPGKHYVFCTCVLPLQWCTRPNCARQRLEHHKTCKCHLEPNHPGGRYQHGTSTLRDTASYSDQPPLASIAVTEAQEECQLAAPAARPSLSIDMTEDERNIDPAKSSVLLPETRALSPRSSLPPVLAAGADDAGMAPATPPSPDHKSP